ncbi:MAG: ribonuclease HII [Proteobacteria bacterium]|nr:ribonuclease HII [Pseudomonadota bacterium]
MQEQKTFPNFLIENSFNDLIVAGIDEAGRGPLAGPVVASCVILDSKNYPKEINDSKKLTAKLRQKIFIELKEKSYFGIGLVDAKKIDEINILQATKLAMKLAYQDLISKYQIFPQAILVDGNFIPFEASNQIQKILPVIKGDQKSLSIAAASIIAKETRDKIMRDLHKEFPQYSWDKNAAYPTKFHIEKIFEFGISKFHRQTFQPIKDLIKK